MFEKELDVAVRDTLFVKVSHFEDKIRLDVRHYYTSKENEELPSKKGINIPIEDSVILARGILDAYNDTVGGNLSIAGETPA